MLTKEDLGQIREVVSEVVLASEKRVVKTIIEAVGEMIDQNILPQIDEIYEEIKGIKGEIGGIKQDIKELKQDVHVLKQDVHVLKEDMKEVKQEIRTINAKMVTKGGLEDRLTDFRLTLATANA